VSSTASNTSASVEEEGSLPGPDGGDNMTIESPQTEYESSKSVHHGSLDFKLAVVIAICSPALIRVRAWGAVLTLFL
jgi:hypothetical protein